MTKIFIYGIFNGEVCEYVGVTINPKNRASAHRRKIMKGRPDWKFRILEEHTPSTIAGAERRMVEFYRAKGQCSLNSFIPSLRLHSSWMQQPEPERIVFQTLTGLLNKLHAMKTAKIVRISQIAKAIHKPESQVSQWVMQRTRRPNGDMAIRLFNFAAKQTLRIATNRRLQPQYRSAYRTACLLFPENEEIKS